MPDVGDIGRLQPVSPVKRPRKDEDKSQNNTRRPAETPKQPDDGPEDDRPFIDEYA